MHYCYILRSKSDKHKNKTYNGYTVNFQRRIRQHNEELVGGAKYTKGKDQAWEIFVLLSGFPDAKNALQCEWRMKYYSKHGYNRPTGRMKMLPKLLNLEKWTSNSTVLNKDLNLKLTVTEDVAHLLYDIPPNVDIEILEKIYLPLND